MVEDVGISVDAVDGGVVGEFTGGESSVEGWDFGGHVGNFVEECTAVASQARYLRLKGGHAY